MPNPFILIILFFFGASIGSFLSVVIYRIQSKTPGIVFGHSFCTHCKKKIHSRDLIPFISYILLKGKCRQCKKSIPIQYLLLEISTGLLMIAIYALFPFAEGNINLLLPFLFYTIYMGFLIGIFFYDLKTQRIPDVFLFPLIAITATGTLIMGNPEIWSALVALIIATLFFGGQIAISKGKWLGEGDLYLSLSLAIIFGWKLFLVCIVTTYFVGAIVSAPLFISKQVKKNTPLPFAPFLIIGALTTIFFGQDILNWYIATITI